MVVAAWSQNLGEEQGVVRVWLPPYQPGSRPMVPYQLLEPRLPDMLQAEKQVSPPAVSRTSHQSWGRRERDWTEQSSVTQTSLTMANCILGGEVGDS